MIQEKIAFFEEIDSAFYPLMEKYQKNGFTVYFFKIDDRYKRKPKIKMYLETKKLVDLSQAIFEYELYRQAAFYAHENVDHIFNKYFGSSPSIKNMCKLLEFPEIENMYKQRLLLELEKAYAIDLKINEVVKSKIVEEAYFFPHNNFKIHSDVSSPLVKNVKVVNHNSVKNNLNRFMARIKKTLFLGVPIFIFIRKVGKISNKTRPKKFKVGIMIPPHPKSIFSMNYLTDTIFIDENELPKEEVLFIDECGQLNINGYKKRGYNYTSLPSPMSTFGLKIDKYAISKNLFLQKIVKRFVPIWLRSLILSLWENPLIVNTNSVILSDYVKWNVFSDNYKIDYHAEKVLPSAISKLHILHQCGIKTCFIYPDNTSVDFHIDWEATKRNQTLYSFMCHDYAMIYGNIVERYFKKHRNYIKNYIKIGVIFSQIITELQEGKLKSILPALIEKKKSMIGKKIIGVFDTVAVDYGPVKIEDGVRFGKDILRLLNEMPEIGIVFRAVKTPELRPPDLNPVYDKLKNHERCLVFSRWEKDGISAAEVIAVSDLVVSAAYTSPTAEALGAKKKAIYYDVAGHDIGDRYYYNRFPNFVAHSYEELKKLINYWLYEINDEEFDDFLNKYIKDEIDPYLDGKALTRVRKFLMGGARAQ